MPRGTSSSKEPKRFVQGYVKTLLRVKVTAQNTADYLLDLLNWDLKSRR